MNKRNLLITLLTIVLGMSSFYLVAQTRQEAPLQHTNQPSVETKTSEKAQAVSTQTLQQISQQLSQAGFTEKIDRILWHPQLRFYEILSENLRTYFLSQDQQFLFASDLYSFGEQGKFTNLSQKNREYKYSELLNDLDQNGLIIFKPIETKAVVYVVFDIDCGYCRKLYKQTDQYLAHGIEMRYLLSPMAPAHSASYKKAMNIWCSQDRKAALNSAVANAAIAHESCDHPINQYVTLAKRLNVAGTPTLFVQGKAITGYVPADKLAEHLNLTT